MAKSTKIDQMSGLDRFTEKARKVIDKGYKVSKKYGYEEYLIVHLFYVLLTDENGVVVDVFNEVGVDVENTINTIERELEDNSNSMAVKKKFNPKFSEELKKLINESFVIASDLSHVYVGTEHMLLAMFKLEDLGFVSDLKEMGIDYSVIKKSVLSTVNYPFLMSQMKNGKGRMRRKSSALPYFCTNMNKLSKEGRYNEISGRDKEIQRLIHILARKTKNNPILVGDAGVGKTAIVEGFVNKLVSKNVTTSFVGKKVLNLDVASILAGAKLRGDVEERINAVIKDAVKDGNTIIFIDEIHTIVGAGTAGAKDSLDIANILKPYLTGSDLSVIGATTADEYRKYFETDSALTRRFQPIFVEEIDKKSAKKILRNLVPGFEKYHKVKIKKEAVEEAVELSSKFIQDRYLPDKAIDIIDEAAASIKIGREVAIEPELKELGKKLINIKKKKTKAINKKNMKKASALKKEEEGIVSEIELVVEGKKSGKKKYSKSVTEDLVRDIIVDWTKIPIAASDISDKTLKGLAQNLKKRIIGQDRVVENVSLAVQRAHLGIGDENRPLSSFLFLGPTGVGKTELAKTLATELFGSESLLYQVDMSEFMENHSVAKLIGSPPGYVGYQEGGKLTTFVRRKPYSVILFDEIEKAHPDVLNILLQILEECHLTDGKGNKVSFKNCIIIMTSNIGSQEISDDQKLGFDIHIEEVEKEEVDEAYDEMRDKVLEQLKDELRTELVNRIDLIDVFRGLNKDDILEITRVVVDDLVVRLVSNGIVLGVDDNVIEKVAEEGYSKEFGGRNVRRKVQEIIENGLASYLLDSKISRKRSEMLEIEVKMKDDKCVFSRKG